jgi:integrase
VTITGRAHSLTSMRCGKKASGRRRPGVLGTETLIGLPMLAGRERVLRLLWSTASAAAAHLSGALAVRPGHDRARPAGAAHSVVVPVAPPGAGSGGDTRRRRRRLDSGIDPKILSDRVGHSNPTITFQVYTHRSTGRDRAAAQLIGQLIEDAVRGDDVAL